VVRSESTLSGDNGLAATTEGGLIHNEFGDVLAGPKTIPDFFQIRDSDRNRHDFVGIDGLDRTVVSSTPASASGGGAGRLQLRSDDYVAIGGLSGSENIKGFDDGQLRLSNTGHGFGVTNAENLSGKTGNFDGEFRRDDGTNTAASGLYCHWDDANSQWVATDGTTFT
jgi:hypothetical protein